MGGHPVAVEAAKRLVRQGVVAVIGSYTSSMTNPYRKYWIKEQSFRSPRFHGHTPDRKKNSGIFPDLPRDDEQAKQPLESSRK